MDQSIQRQLVDKIYEKRKQAALDLEKQIRECQSQGDQKRIQQIIEQLVDMFSNPSNPLHVKNGGLIGLAGTAIALGVDIAPYMDKFIEHLLICFSDPENRIRYFSAECLYNIAKVAKGEILIYFNPIFDALSKLAADSELSVKNGAELLDRLLKDIVAESASEYVPQYAETEKTRLQQDQMNQGILIPYPTPDDASDYGSSRKAFSLAHFIPLLSERIYVASPFTRSFLVSWILVLDSVPELELITYLPEFLDGLFQYLADPNDDVRIATVHLLADFLSEMKTIAAVQKRTEEKIRHIREPNVHDEERRAEDRLPDITMMHTDRAAFIPEGEHLHEGEIGSDIDIKDTGAYVPGQNVKVDHAAIVEILLSQLGEDHVEIQMSTALQWLGEFLLLAPDVMLPFTPRLLLVILPNLAHHVPMIVTAAHKTDALLFRLVESVPSPSPMSLPGSVDKASIASGKTSIVSPGPTQTFTLQATSPPPTSGGTTSPVPPRQSTLASSLIDGPPDVTASPASDRTIQPSNRQRSVTSSIGDMAHSDLDGNSPKQSRSQSPTPTAASNTAAAPLQMSGSEQDKQGNTLSQSPIQADSDPFDYRDAVNNLTIQFLSEHEETRIDALTWLIMLHEKVPRKILAMDDGTFPVLLKTLSDSSEEVIKKDLALLAQISLNSEESYFKAFMKNLHGLFSTDRRLLDHRGGLIIRQLCVNLNTERIYKSLAEILEQEEDLEFASVMIQKLNLILITSTELADFRRRLKSLETRQDGQALFTTLYKSWCHNALAVFSLCLLAQAYEHASNLLSIFADLEITVPFLVQVDKLVQLIESPVFTYLRLQLLEPEKYPYLFKCLYGLLMLLPQSSAFVSLRNRLNAVNSAGFLHIAPKTTTFSGRSKIGGRPDDIKWQDLLTHFRTVQVRHERYRRGEESSVAAFEKQQQQQQQRFEKPGLNGIGAQITPGRPVYRRRVTGTEGLPPPGGSGNAGQTSPIPGSGEQPTPQPQTRERSRTGGILSPLNPRRVAPGALLGFASGAATRPKSPSLQAAAQSKQRRPTGLGR